MTARMNFMLGLALAAGVIGTATLMYVDYRRQTTAGLQGYGASVKGRDVIDTSSSALAALQDAEINAQYYALTGETIYREGYSTALMGWEDSFGTLELLVKTERGQKYLVTDFSTKAKQVMDELAMIVSVHDEESSAAAMERMRKGSAPVYLGQAKVSIGKLIAIANDDVTRGSMSLVGTAMRLQRRLAAGAAAIFAMMLLGVGLALADRRRIKAAVAR